MYLAHFLDSHPISIEPDPTALRELRQFIAGDRAPVNANPAFREELREQLWTMLSKRLAERTGAD